MVPFILYLPTLLLVLIYVQMFQRAAMEEDLRRDNHRDQPPCGELEVPSRRYCFSG